jgi:hypothetical protein
MHRQEQATRKMSGDKSMRLGGFRGRAIGIDPQIGSLARFDQDGCNLFGLV